MNDFSMKMKKYMKAHKENVREVFMRELYEFCLQHETCSNCPMFATCVKNGLEQKFSVYYEEYLINREELAKNESE